ncbi:MAG TPA: BolA family protein [Casimicrobiaceae bacterium]|nr:BolA family protein [Casimicrobiaceae bacterium]
MSGPVPERTAPHAAAPPRGVIAALEARLAPLAPVELEIRDDSARHVGHAGAASGAGHFSMTIVSEHFLGLTRLARHRAVLDRVGDLIPYPVHALAISAYAPDERRSDERMKQ